MKSKQNYWRKRAVEYENAAMKISRDTVEKRLASHYKKALREIREDMLKLYGTFAKDNGIDFSEAKQMLGSKEFREWRMSIQEYLKGIESGDKGLERELNVLAMRPRINRLEKLYSENLQALDDLGRKVGKDMRDFLSKSYHDSYAKDIFDLVKVGGLAVELAKLDNVSVTQVLASRWSGKNYSQRIWKNTQLLSRSIRDTISQGVNRGLSIQQMSRNLENKMQSGYRNAVRLVRTEMNFVNNQAHADSMKDAGIEAYEFIAVMDNRTSSACKSRDGETYLLEEKSVGFNYPPLHPRCRSTVCPFIEGISKKGTRIAKVGKDTIQVPANMTYKDFEKVYLKKEISLDQWNKQNPLHNNAKNGVKSTNKLTTTLKNTTINNKNLTTSDLKNFEEFKNYWQSKYHIEVADSFAALDFKAVNEAAQGIESVIKEFPKAVKTLKGLDAGDLKEWGFGDAYMGAIYEGWINFDTNYFSSYAALGRDIANDVHYGHHPKNTTIFGIAAHEMGHILERALILKNGGGIPEWDNCIYAEKIVQEATKIVQSTPEGKRRITNYKGEVSLQKIPVTMLKRRISAYATENYSECLAEAVCDYITNGENAQPLSKEIWRLLKEELS